MIPLSNEDKHEIWDNAGALTPWASRALELLRPLSMNPSGTFRETVNEWAVWDMVDNGPNPSRWGSCTICHNDGIRYSYSIKNRYTEHRVEAIGSVCIQCFMENADIGIKTAQKKMQAKTRLNWLEEIGARSHADGKFVKSVDDFSKENSGLTPKQLIALIRIGERYDIPLPIGIYQVKLRRNKDKSQFKGLSQDDIKRIIPFISPAQRSRYL